MRATKKTTISFGLVSVPVKLYKAVEDHDVHLHQYHGGCGGGVGIQRVCKVCETEVPYADIVKGAEASNGTVVTFTADDLHDLEDEQDGGVELVQVCELAEVDALRFDSAYYLEPDKVSSGYRLLAKVLADSNRVGIVRLALRTRTSMAVLRVLANGVMALHTLHWDDEIRPTTELNLGKDLPANDQMLAVATKLVDSMVKPFDPAAFTDSYTERLAEVIEARSEGEQTDFVAQARPATATDDVSDLLAKLEASIAKSA